MRDDSEKHLRCHIGCIERDADGECPTKSGRRMIVTAVRVRMPVAAMTMSMITMMVVIVGVVVIVVVVVVVH